MLKNNKDYNINTVSQEAFSSSVEILVLKKECAAKTQILLHHVFFFSFCVFLQLCVAARLQENFQQCESEHLGPVDTVRPERQRVGVLSQRGTEQNQGIFYFSLFWFVILR